ncbi:ABC transporter B family member 4-like isoform X2 [Populus nigra]|uniref:ABC transporter B family member 4-like isoform X2 n=1 Tax=Populus nigra TaxID=3691 RepID=UPI002B26A28F|nr:ABC transporter B family member 4-like isoform X2 [Populus nigra]
MAVENGRNGDKSMDDASPSKSLEVEEKSSGGRGDQQETVKSKGDEETKTVPFLKLFSFADSTDILLMILGTIGAVGNGASFQIMSILFGDMLNSFGQNQNNKDVVDLVTKVSLNFVYLGIGSAVAAFLQVACWMVTGERQAARIRGTYLKTILKQDVAFFDKETNTGEVVGRMSGDTVLIQDAMGEKVGKFIQLVSTFIGGFIVAFVKGWLLTLVMLSSIPLVVIAGAGLAIIIARMASRGQTAYAKAATVVEQTIGSIRTVASFTGEKQAISNYKKFLATAYNSGVQEGFTAGLGLGIVMLLVFCSYALAVWFGGKMILEKGYNGGDVLSVIFAVLTGSMSLGQASPCMSAFAAGQAAAYKMSETINRKPEIDSSDTRGKILDDISGDVELRDVYFTYPARPDEQIFSGFSLFIPSGTTTALVGQSGSGKSTVISLIERFYDPQAGEVLKEFQLKWIREKIGLVSQEPVLFASSIKDNIAYGKDGATTEDIRAAAELANAAKFIDKLPQGIDTMVGEHGTQLSGGQKQRIAIARAILKDPRILLLDEATSALDAESERIVQEALDRIMVNRTTVIVAHRLSTVRNADMIAVIYRGKMVEKGSHSELLKDPEGAYSQLIRLQEVNKESKQETEDPKESSISEESLRQSSQRISLKRSISRGSSGVGHSSRHSLSLSFGLPTGFNVPDNPTSELEVSPQKQQTPDVPISRLAYLNKPEVPVLIAGSIAAILSGVIFPIYSILLSSVIKTFFEPPDELRKDSKFWALMFMTLGLASFVVYPSQTYLFSVAGSKLIQRIRSMCFEKVVHMEVGWFDEPEHSSGAIGARLSADAATVRALVGDSLSQLVQNIASAVAGLVIAFAASWQLALVILVLVPLIGLNGFVQVKFMKGFSADAKKMYEEASQVANDAVGSIRTVASFCAEEKVMQLYRRKCEGPMRTGIRQGMLSGTGFGVSFFLLYSVYATTFYVGAQLVQHGKTTFAEVFRPREQLLPYLLL